MADHIPTPQAPRATLSSLPTAIKAQIFKLAREQDDNYLDRIRVTFLVLNERERAEFELRDGRWYGRIANALFLVNKELSALAAAQIFAVTRSCAGDWVRGVDADLPLCRRPSRPANRCSPPFDSLSFAATPLASPASSSTRCALDHLENTLFILSTLPRLRHISMTGTTITQLFQPPRPRRLFQPYRDNEQVARKLAFRAAAARTGTLALVNIRPADASFGLEYVPNLEKLEPSYLDIAEENSAVDPTDPLRGIVDQSATLMRLSLNLIDGRKPMLDWEGVVIPNLQYFALRISTLEDADWTFLAANASRLKVLDLRSYRLWRCPCRPRSRARPSHPSSTSTSPPFRSCNRSCPPSSHPPFARSPASPNSLPVTWQPSPSPPPRTRRPTLPQHSSSNPHPRHHRPLAPSDSFSTRKRY